MRARVLDQPDVARRHPKPDELLAEKLDPQRRAVGRRQLIRANRGDPVLAHEIAHWRTWAYAGKKLVVLFSKHRLVLLCATRGLVPEAMISRAAGGCQMTPAATGMRIRAGFRETQGFVRG